MCRTRNRVLSKAADNNIFPPERKFRPLAKAYLLLHSADLDELVTSISELESGVSEAESCEFPGMHR